MDASTLDVVADVIIMLIVPWIVTIERRLSRIEGYLKLTNGRR